MIEFPFLTFSRHSKISYINGIGPLQTPLQIETTIHMSSFKMSIKLNITLKVAIEFEKVSFSICLEYIKMLFKGIEGSNVKFDVFIDCFDSDFKSSKSFSKM